ncbi:hypothetical protein [Methylophaga sp.]|uniref:hypothetical protein n=1 Tax=Methylophaga sp. TaxID=2024840 RepID=UPI003A8DE311
MAGMQNNRKATKLNTSKAAYDFYSTNPSFWYQKSVSLYASATLVRNGVLVLSEKEFSSSLGLKGAFSAWEGCEHPYLMLMGQSYEVLLKAICLTQGTPFPMDKHDLLAVAESAGIKPMKNEKVQLRLLSEFISWEGRYPVPKSHGRMTQHWNATRKSLWQEDERGKRRTDIFEHENLKALWLKLQEKYWANVYNNSYK